MKYLSTIFALAIAFTATSCSVDEDFNNYDNCVVSEETPVITGTWEATITQYYTEGVGYSQPGRGREYWIISDNNIAEYDKADDTYYSSSSYTFDGKSLIIADNRVWNVVSKNEKEMLLRMEVYKGMFQETMFKRIDK